MLSLAKTPEWIPSYLNLRVTNASKQAGANSQQRAIAEEYLGAVTRNTLWFEEVV